MRTNIDCLNVSVRLRVILPEILIYFSYPLLQLDGSLPSQSIQLAYIHQLPRRAIGFGKIMYDLPFITRDLFDQQGQLPDLQVLSGPDIDKARLIVSLHQEKTGIRQIIGVQEFPPWLARTP